MLFRKIFRGVSGSVFIRFLSRCLFLVVVASCASESYAQDVPSSPGSETNSVQKIWTRVLDVNQNYLDAIKTYEVEEEVTNISHKRLGSLSSEVRKRISISQFKFHPKSWIEAVEKTKVHLLGKGDPYRTLRYNISDRKKTLSGVDVAKLNPEIGEIESFVQVLYQGEKKYRYAIQDFLSNPTLSAQFKPFFYISSDAPRRLNVPIESSDPLDG